MAVPHSLYTESQHNEEIYKLLVHIVAIYCNSGNFQSRFFFVFVIFMGFLYWFLILVFLDSNENYITMKFPELQ